MDSVDEIAALTPVPAPGAARAYTAILGMAVVDKVVSFELDRKKIDPGPRANPRVAQQEIERI